LPLALAVLFVASLGTCHAQQVVFQFDAQKNAVTTQSNIVWTSISRTPEKPLKLVADKNEWQFTNQNGSASVANVGGITATPLEFETDTPTNVVVRHIVAVVTNPEEIRALSTLFCGELVYRAASRPWNTMSSTNAAIDRGRFCAVAWKIDGVEGAPLVGGKNQLLEITFSSDVMAHTMGIGNDTGRREWLRAYCGDFKEILAFSAPISGDARDAVLYYLNVKWRLGLSVPRATTWQVAEARALGTHFGSFFGSLLILR